jgi:hypothetical protein
MSTAGPALRTRPEPAVWSAIEYAAHSRDITALHVYGVEQALTGAEPVYPPIANDLIETAAATYGELDPELVVTELATKASLLADIAGRAGATPGREGSPRRRAK